MVVIRQDDRFLLGKRAEWKKTAAGYWCPISGKIEPGESEPQAVEREVLEETSLSVKAIRKLQTIDSHDGRVRLHWWEAQVTAGVAQLEGDENTALGWFTISEIEQLRPIFQEDIAVLKSTLS